MKRELLLEVLDEFACLGVTSVFFSGEGESLLHPDLAELISHSKKNELNELGYHGFIENLDLIEKEGLSAELMCASEPYFGRRWGDVILEIQQAYQEIIDSIQSKGFGLGGLIYNAEFSSLLRST